MTVKKINHFIDFLNSDNKTRPKKIQKESIDRQMYFESKKQARQREKRQKQYRLLNPKWQSNEEIESAREEVRKGQEQY